MQKPDKLFYRDAELGFMCFFSRILYEILYDVSIKIKHFHIIDAARDYVALRFRYKFCDGRWLNGLNTMMVQTR